MNIGKIKITSVGDMLSLIDRFQQLYQLGVNYSTFLFRGDEDYSHSLLPRIFRLLNQERQREKSGFPVSEYGLFSRFRNEAAAFLPNLSQSDCLTWLFYAQHYGVPTRLLDLTSNPLVALYFCCMSQSSTDGSLWILQSLNYDRNSLEDNFREYFYPGPCLEAINSIMRLFKDGPMYYDEQNSNPMVKLPVLITPPYIDQRMQNQSSRFLLWGESEAPLEQQIEPENWMFKKNSSHHDVQTTPPVYPFLAKALIPSVCKSSIINQLDLMGINEKFILPGLQSIGQYTGLHY